MSDFKSDYGAIYRRAYEYHEKYRGARLPEELQRAANDLKSFQGTTFEADLAIVVYDEIVRDAATPRSSR